ncbi:MULTISPECIES: sulfatase-like hydrolase/transferase [Mesonia]|uniref:Arylsulfatase n=1 Tax=Mesonia oceanica TaxID=2687242 RepID=A0AC61Y9B8_9FLAO|nr:MULTISPECIES: sulfatase-like hydrolase/transferase [Mesonia]MAN27067.1 arylsulfatase [Mesonia sp.]MAQ41423.1 arylsulfatase [Mesonia sp.]VVV00473.1 Arylsulfatase [Mesonia oceanica]|tara:strand:- start:8488 stop:9888 length:1401 start_codon:yes stop_codon:yes gene_type:complete
MIYQRKDLQLSVLLLSSLIITCFSCKNEKKTSEVNQEASKASFTEKPNFLIIIADDAGWNDMSFHGSEIQTPHLDQLAQNGIQLERFYVNPTCSPSRASLLTGMPASRIGIVAPISGRSEKTLPDTIVTLPQALKKANYQTALMGKWHLGLSTESGPEAYGFDYSYGFLHGQIDQYSHHYKNGDPSWHRQGKLIEEEGHATDLITQEAIKWLEKQKGTHPFFLQLAYSAPHVPLQEPEKWKEKYNFIKNKSRRDYAAAMAHLDDAIGQVLNRLDSLGLRKNTIVLFMSDNGAQENWNPTTQYEGKYGPNDQLGSNQPLRDYKTSNYEGAIRVPAILSWNGIAEAEKDKNYLSVIDVMPTFLELAKVQVPEQVEGNSFTSVVKEKSSEHHEIYVRGHKQESFIQKPWKLVRTRHLNSATEFELYNIEQDPSEEKEVIDKYPVIAKKMKQALEEQFSKDANEVNVPLQ